MTEDQFIELADGKAIRAVLLPGGWVEATGEVSIAYLEHDPKREHLLSFSSSEGKVVVLLDEVVGVRLAK
ncbi:MAG: hypothetical protein O6929_04050 [candidate division NC10 bacterium]|nr:hypothetical protein [candidate division NC10 bacterium]